MAFNKTKALETALKSLSQGKVAQAISEYQAILRYDPKDQATLMTVGDLYARQGDMPHAIEYFERLAQVYLSDGFNSKAIAIYKKIAKLAPSELPPLERLADLYVQQGVLSEARPLFLQIAEAHLKANRAPKAVEVLQRLLEVEPENPRVQMRLAEIYNVMGRKKEAAQTYFGYAQRLFDRGISDEARKLVDRALEVDPSHPGALLLKAKLLAAAQDDAPAIALLEIHPDVDAGEEVTNLLLDLQIRSNRIEDAASRARKQLASDASRFAMLHRIAHTLIETSRTDQAMPLLRELRDPMIEVGEQDAYLKSLTLLTEKIPHQSEPLEILAEFCRHTSDPFHLTDALNQLLELYLAEGKSQRAEEILQELADRNKGDERYLARLNALRSGTPVPEEASEIVAPEPQFLELHSDPLEVPQAPSEPSPAFAEPALDDDTQRYIAQALTDVDLFSSYGLTQKATHLLENILQRAPRHAPTLERLLDMHLGAGDARRTAEIASHLEQIHGERGDQLNAERFAELRRRYQSAAGISDEELSAVAPSTFVGAPPPAAAASSTTLASPNQPIAQPAIDEFVLAVEQGESAASPEGEPVTFAPEFDIPVAPDDSSQSASPVAAAPGHNDASVVSGEELDLSDEWEAMVREVSEPPAASTEEVISAPRPPSQPEQSPAEAQLASPSDESEFEIEVVEIAGEEVDSSPASQQPEAVEISAEESVESSSADFELELMSDSASSEASLLEMNTDNFLRDLAAEFADLEPLEISSFEPEASDSAPAAHASPSNQPANSETSPENLNELSAVFQEFREEMGEMAQDDEDIETHYNLGIAYREMGLLDESIGEFQRVANALQKGKPFDQSMNCFTFLALCFLDKGEPKISAMWYERALEIPGLDPESILALRYDLAVALEIAGEAEAALNRFRQVYAVNIDYRDVADHIATLQH